MKIMLTEFFNTFVKVTGWLPQKIAFRTKIEYEDKAVQGRRIKGPAIIISNHTSVFDYAVLLFVFFTRTLRVQMAEVLFQKQPLGLFLKMMGGIYVNRDTHDFSFMGKSEELLRKGKVVGIFPDAQKRGAAAALQAERGVYRAGCRRSRDSRLYERQLLQLEKTRARDDRYADECTRLHRRRAQRERKY